MKTVRLLYSLQDEILSALSEFAKKNDFPFVLTGGTTLVRFLLKGFYRVSYDLDFFSNRLNVFVTGSNSSQGYLG
jgi:predicted nucleotidyltransferase component of viral defense system